MKITFLGSSHGVPEPNRRCSCTMIEVNGCYYFIDMGVMVFDDLITRGIDVADVKAAFFTHMHGDHTNGLIHFADLLSWKFKDADPLIYLPRLAAADVITAWIAATGSSQRELSYRQVAAGELYSDEHIKITAIATQHCPDSYAYLVEAEGKTVLFTGDLKRPGVDFPQLGTGKQLDMVVCETAHFPSTEYIPVFAQYDIKKVCVNHYSPRFHKSVLELVEQLDIPVTLATDNYELTL